ncbi:SCO family protein [Benzoatithermus flavus]|uniref:SCO family protein n=1 Tax=Benzoatithermus flavus TaxID=3108223 RepID=A0ABU8XRW0_9PROT
MQRRMFFATGAAALAGAATGGADRVWGASAPAASTHSIIPNVRVLDQDGREHRFYDGLVKDRVVLINFFYTSCGETCPLVTENLRAVQDLLGERAGRDIFMYSVTLQPELETPAILADYAALWDIRPGWKFLTGAPDEIERLRRAIGFASADPTYDRIKDNHTGIVRYGNDRLDRWAGTAGLGRPAWIAKAVTALAEA